MEGPGNTCMGMLLGITSATRFCKTEAFGCEAISSLRAATRAVTPPKSCIVMHVHSVELMYDQSMVQHTQMYVVVQPFLNVSVNLS
jgi:hypothetical protein